MNFVIVYIKSDIIRCLLFCLIGFDSFNGMIMLEGEYEEKGGYDSTLRPLQSGTASISSNDSGVRPILGMTSTSSNDRTLRPVQSMASTSSNDSGFKDGNSVTMRSPNNKRVHKSSLKKRSSISSAFKVIKKAASKELG